MENIQLILSDYLRFIDDFRIKLLKSTGKNFFDIDVKMGTIDYFTYLFHGAGCRLEKDGVVCEFDFLPENEYPIKFTVWEIYEFIRTNKIWQHLTMELSDIESKLAKQVENGKLNLLELGGMVFKVFQVKNMEFDFLYD
ncbi:DUF6896 domain-containing protein [Sphingobacterium sp. LRF_L2]|uniref:DUF6896 domain-containing protein n=1 Tax=Sphingobacterium sp. LRF_L2 TaxID=3369421 RepID=UPI003F630334